MGNEFYDFCKDFGLRSDLKFASHIEENLSDETKIILLKFMLSFNIFEARFYKQPPKKSLKVTDRNKTIQGLINSLPDYDPEKDYYFLRKHFRQRYQRIASLHSLYLRDHDDKNFEKNIESFLNADNLSTEQLENYVYYLLSISYKFRNNLFHGDKEPKQLENFKEEFKKITIFMNHLIVFLSNHDIEPV